MNKEFKTLTLDDACRLANGTTIEWATMYCYNKSVVSHVVVKNGRFEMFDNNNQSLQIVAEFDIPINYDAPMKWSGQDVIYRVVTD